jgi:hypothetical protein
LRAALVLADRGRFILTHFAGLRAAYFWAMNDARRCIAGLIALVMLVTSGAMAVARGQAYDATGAVIICTGHGVIVAWVDDEGQPVEAPHLCPDCVLASVDPVPVMATRRADTQMATALHWPRPAQVVPLSAPRGIQARAPPVRV